jgi:hypothetical protein
MQIQHPNIKSDQYFNWLLQEMERLAILNISRNDLHAKGGVVLAEALNGNQVMIELDISDNSLAEDEMGEPDMSGVIALASVISGMGALAKLGLSSNYIPPEQQGELQRVCAASGIDLAI